ncbi:hypothetical protein [uncultured Pedobacter sp.]|uniref:hypothetical protein n=1 Tax=uncultured Pedobacter sp. TaxID=246139 RepID=UPI0025EA44F1|nr:hypothetical protein [uncultured Pedobacter sp.]
MHPYIEIIFSLLLAFLGILMMRKLNFLKRNSAGAKKRSYATAQYFKLLYNKISFRFMILLFTLVMIVAIAILMEKGVMNIIW